MKLKTASVPFHDLIFNSSERFNKIISTAGDDFDLVIKNLPENDRYIIACTVVLSFCYGYNINLKRPFYYEIPDGNGITRFYKILYNAEFIEIIPTDKAKKITQKDYEELLDNFDNIEIWKKKFPPNSYLFNGFVISNIFDITQDQSISNIKSALISEGQWSENGFTDKFKAVFSSLFELQDIEVGFSLFKC